MITHSPESPMPEPYHTYVAQRAAKISDVLKTIVDDTNVQLCPRAITPGERVFGDEDEAIIYGCIVDDLRDGYKTALYTGNEFTEGIAAYSVDEALRYASQVLEDGNKVRIKDPRHSNGSGQQVAETIEEVTSIVRGYDDLQHGGLVLMPDLEQIFNRYSAGRIDLKQHGTYDYYGYEDVVNHEGHEVFGGGEILLARHANKPNLEAAADRHDIPSAVRKLANKALDLYAKQVVHMGRASVDVVDGVTHNGSRLLTVIDVTPRVGGHTAAETLAIASLKASGDPDQVVRAHGRLQYNPTPTTDSEGTKFVDTPSLVITASVLGAE